MFHRNIGSSDTSTASQTFIKGASGNKFGYNTDGTAKWGTSGQFGKWDRSGYTLVGWNFKSTDLVKQYSVYSGVSDSWIQNVLNKVYATQTKAGEVHLYAVWGRNVDLGLFWGQSNMVGSVGTRANEKQKDTRNMSGLIDSDIISNYTTMSHVNVPIKSSTAYEFRVGNTTTGGLRELKASTEILSEKLIYTGGKLRAYQSGDSYFSSNQSQGTNMIPQFAKTYNDQTGHVLVAVMSAYSSQRISSFLPHGVSPNTDNKYQYEAMKTKYNMAVTYLETHGYKVKNRFYVVYQGCADTSTELSSGTLYYDTFMKVHNNIKKDMGITFGAIVELSGRIASLDIAAKKTAINNIHNQHERLINNNSDIILGSRFAWNAYINRKANAFALTDNSIHLTSAGLSQIGKESAINVAKKIS